MKKIIAVILLFIVSLTVIIHLILRKNQLSILNPQIINSSLSPTPLPTSSVKGPTVTWNDITYEFAYFEVTDISKLALLANFTQKKSSELILKESNCQYAINGGFYDKNDKPLGLFMNFLLKTPAIENSLVNGYIAITNKSTVGFDLPNNPTIALQTGPMLINDGKKLKLAIINDEFARRMIAGMTSKGTLIFMTIFIPETKVQGPQLQDLPDILERTKLDIVSAINLDGGNASMFKNLNISISEVSSVGSLFCLKE